MTHHPDIERSAYNSAFHALRLPWHWDASTYAMLCRTPCERQRLLDYLQTEHPHLLRAYDGNALADAILESKRRLQTPLAHCAPGHVPQVNWADARWGETGF